MPYTLLPPTNPKQQQQQQQQHVLGMEPNIIGHWSILLLMYITVAPKKHDGNIEYQTHVHVLAGGGGI